MSDLLTLNNIAKRNGDIVCATLGNNLKRANTGKDGFGEVVIAVDNKNILRIVNGQMAGVLYLTTIEEWRKEKENKGMVTEINIDYYEELKAKADKVEKAKVILNNVKYFGLCQSTERILFNLIQDLAHVFEIDENELGLEYIEEVT